MQDAVGAGLVAPLPATDACQEASLIAEAQRDPRAFLPLYTRYVDAVYRYCYRRLGNVADAEDATSDVFLRALAALPRYRNQAFRSWLFAIAHHVVVDKFRVARPEHPLDAVADRPDPGIGPDEHALAAQEQTRLAMLLAQLPADQRDVLELRMSGLRSAEVAQALGRSPAAIRSLQFRAVTRLRELLAAAGESEEEHHARNR